MAKLIQELKGYQAVKDLVEGELSDYSYWTAGELKWNDNYGDYEEDDEQEHYEINITNNRDKSKTLAFNYNKKEEPNLRGSDEIQELRDKKQEEFKSFFRKDTVHGVITESNYLKPKQTVEVF